MNDPRIKAYDLRGGMSCPACQFLIDAATPVTNSTPRGFKKGNIVICVNCSAVLRVGDSSFIRLSDADIKVLDPVSKEVIRKTVQKVRERIDAAPGN